MIYFIRAGESGPVKIGTSVQPLVRLAELQIAHYETLRIIRLFEGGENEEAALHVRFADLHIKGEWHAFSRLMLADVGLVEILPDIEPAPRALDPGELPTSSDIELRARAAGLSVAEVCRRADIAVSTFWRWKTGKTNPSVIVCKRLMDATQPAEPTP